MAEIKIQVEAILEEGSLDKIKSQIEGLKPKIKVGMEMDKDATTKASKVMGDVGKQGAKHFATDFNKGMKTGFAEIERGLISNGNRIAQVTTRTRNGIVQGFDLKAIDSKGQMQKLAYGITDGGRLIEKSVTTSAKKISNAYQKELQEPLLLGVDESTKKLGNLSQKLGKLSDGFIRSKYINKDSKIGKQLKDDLDEMRAFVNGAGKLAKEGKLTSKHIAEMENLYDKAHSGISKANRTGRRTYDYKKEYQGMIDKMGQYQTDLYNPRKFNQESSDVIKAQKRMARASKNLYGSEGERLTERQFYENRNKINKAVNEGTDIFKRASEASKDYNYQQRESAKAERARVKAEKELYNSNKRLDSLDNDFRRMRRSLDFEGVDKTTEAYQRNAEAYEKLVNTKKKLRSEGDRSGRGTDKLKADMATWKQDVADDKHSGELGYSESYLAKEARIQRRKERGVTMARALSYGIGMKAMQGFINQTKQGFAEVMSLDDSLTDLLKVVDDGELTRQSSPKFIQQMNETAKKIGHTTAGAIDSVTQFKKLGYDLPTAKALGETALIYSNVGDVDAVTASDSITSTLKGFGLDRGGSTQTQKEAIKLVDMMNEVGNNFAIDSGGIGEALRRSASSLKVAGNTVEESIAMITTANAVVQDPQQVGNAFKTISMNLNSIDKKTGLPKLQGMLQDLAGIDMKKANGELKNTYEILSELGGKWHDIDEEAQHQLVEGIAGKHRANVLASLLDNTEEMGKVFETAKNSEGSAMKEQEAYMESLSAKMNILKQSGVGLWSSILDTGTLQSGIGFLNKVVGSTDKLIENFGVLGVGATGASTIGMFTTDRGHSIMDWSRRNVKDFVSGKKSGRLRDRFKVNFSDWFTPEAVVDASTRIREAKETGTIKKPKNERGFFRDIFGGIRDRFRREKSHSDYYDLDIDDLDIGSASKKTKSRIEDVNLGKTKKEFSDLGDITEKVSKNTKDMGKAMSSAEKTMKGASSTASDLGEAVSETARATVRTTKATSKSGFQFGKFAKSGLSSLAGLGAGLATGVGIPLAIGAVTSFVSGQIAKRKEEKESLKNMAQEYQADNEIQKERISTMENLATAYEDYNKKIMSKGGIHRLSNDELEEYKNIRNEIAQQSPEIVKGYDREGNAIIQGNRAVQQSLEFEKRKKQLKDAEFVSKKEDRIKALGGDYGEEYAKLEKSLKREEKIRKSYDKLKKDMAKFDDDYQGHIGNYYDGSLKNVDGILSNRFITGMDKARELESDLLREMGTASSAQRINLLNRQMKDDVASILPAEMSILGDSIKESLKSTDGLSSKNIVSGNEDKFANLIKNFMHENFDASALREDGKTGKEIMEEAQKMQDTAFGKFAEMADAVSKEKLSTEELRARFEGTGKTDEENKMIELFLNSVIPELFNFGGEAKNLAVAIENAERATQEKYETDKMGYQAHIEEVFGKEGAKKVMALPDDKRQEVVEGFIGTAQARQGIVDNIENVWDKNIPQAIKEKSIDAMNNIFQRLQEDVISGEISAQESETLMRDMGARHSDAMSHIYNKGEGDYLRNQAQADFQAMLEAGHSMENTIDLMNSLSEKEIEVAEGAVGIGDALALLTKQGDLEAFNQQLKSIDPNLGQIESVDELSKAVQGIQESLATAGGDLNIDKGIENIKKAREELDGMKKGEEPSADFIKDFFNTVSDASDGFEFSDRITEFAKSGKEELSSIMSLTQEAMDNNFLGNNMEKYVSDRLPFLDSNIKNVTENVEKLKDGLSNMSVDSGLEELGNIFPQISDSISEFVDGDMNKLQDVVSTMTKGLKEEDFSSMLDLEQYLENEIEGLNVKVKYDFEEGLDEVTSFGGMPIENGEPVKVPAQMELSEEGITSFGGVPIQDGEPIKVPAQVELSEEGITSFGGVPLEDGEPIKVPAQIELSEEGITSFGGVPIEDGEPIKVPAQMELSEEGFREMTSFHGMPMEDMSFVLNVEGTEKLEEASNKAEELNGKTTSVTIEADSSKLEEANSKAEEMNGKTVTTNVNADSSQLDEANSKTEEMNGKTVTTNVNVNSSGIDKANQDMNNLSNKTINPKIKVDSSPLDRIKSMFSNILGKKKDVTVTAKTEGEGKVRALKSEIEGTPDNKESTLTADASGAIAGVAKARGALSSLPTSHTIYIDFKVGNAPTFAMYKGGIVGNTYSNPHYRSEGIGKHSKGTGISIPAYSKGTGGSPTHKELKKRAMKRGEQTGTNTEFSLVGEHGWELAILPNGQMTRVGKQRPEIVALPYGTEIIPHGESVDIAKYTGYSQLEQVIPRYAKGTGAKIGKYAEGTEGAKKVDFYLYTTEISRLTDEVKRYNDAVKMTDVEQEKIKYLEKLTETYQNQKKAYHEYAQAMRTERDNLVETLKGAGFTFEGEGDTLKITNPDTLEGKSKDIEEAFKKFDNIQNKEIPKAKADWRQAEMDIEEAQKDAKELVQKRINMTTDRIVMEVDMYNDRIKMIKDKIDVLDKTDFIGKNESQADMYEAQQEKLSNLTDELHRLAEIQPVTVDGAKKLSDAMNKVQADMRNTYKELRKLNREMIKTQFDSIKNNYDLFSDNIKNTLSVINNNVDMLGKGLIPDFTPELIMPIPDLSQIMEENRMMADRQYAEQREFSEISNDWKRASLDEKLFKSKKFTTEEFLSMVDEYEGIYEEIDAKYGNLSKGQLKEIKDEISVVAVTHTEVEGMKAEHYKKLYNGLIDSWLKPESEATKKHFEDMKRVIKDDLNAIASIYSDGWRNILNTISNNISTIGAIVTAKSNNPFTYVPAYATGGVHEGGRALVGEVGYEIAFLPNGKSTVLGKHGAELVDLPKGTEILNHRESQEIARYTGFNKLERAIPKYAEGTTSIIEAFRGWRIEDVLRYTKIKEKAQILFSRYGSWQHEEIQKLSDENEKIRAKYGMFGDAFPLEELQKFTEALKRANGKAHEFMMWSKADLEEYVSNKKEAQRFYQAHGYWSDEIRDRNEALRHSYGMYEDNYSYAEIEAIFSSKEDNIKRIQQMAPEERKRFINNKLQAERLYQIYGTWNTPEIMALSEENERLRLKNNIVIDDLTAHELIASLRTKNYHQPYEKENRRMRDEIASFTEQAKEAIEKSRLNYREKGTLDSQQEFLDVVDKQATQLSVLNAEYAMQLNRQKQEATKKKSMEIQEQLEYAVSSGDVELINKLRQELEKAIIDGSNAEKEYYKLVEQRYKAETAITDKKIKREKDLRSILKDQYDVLNKYRKSDYEDRVALSDKLSQSHAKETTLIKENLKIMEREMAKNSIDSPEWKVLKERYEDEQKKLSNAYSNQIKQEADKMSISFESIVKAIEKKIVDTNDIDERRKEISKERKELNRIMLSEERKAESRKLRRKVIKEEVDLTDEEWAFLDSEDEIKKKDYELEKGKINLKILQKQLENAKNNKKIEYYSPDGQGGVQIEYTYDQDVIDRLQNEIDSLIAKNARLERETALEDESEEIEDVLDLSKEFEKLSKKYIAGEYETDEEYYEALYKAQKDYFDSASHLTEEEYKERKIFIEEQMNKMISVAKNGGGRIKNLVDEMATINTNTLYQSLENIHDISEKQLDKISDLYVRKIGEIGDNILKAFAENPLGIPAEDFLELTLNKIKAHKEWEETGRWNPNYKRANDDIRDRNNIMEDNYTTEEAYAHYDKLMNMAEEGRSRLPNIPTNHIDMGNPENPYGMSDEDWANYYNNKLSYRYLSSRGLDTREPARQNRDIREKYNITDDVIGGALMNMSPDDLSRYLYLKLEAMDFFEQHGYWNQSYAREAQAIRDLYGIRPEDDPITYENTYKLKNLFNIRRFASGGRTGKWGSSARLAFLDENEIVTTSKQTDKFDSFVNSLPNLSSVLNNLNNQYLENINSNMYNNKTQEFIFNFDKLELPNVKDGNDATELVRGLKGLALQEVNRL